MATVTTGHRFVRYADDLNVFVNRRGSGTPVLKSVSKHLSRRIKLKVNEAKSAVGLPWEREFLGISFSTRINRRISKSSIKIFMAEVREATYRTRDQRIEKIVRALRQNLLG